MKRVRVKGALLLALGGLVVALVPAASASNGPGALKCPLPVYNPTHWGLQVGTSVTCTIEGASDLAPGTTSVNVIVKSSVLGNTTVIGSVSGTTITFTYTAPANACSTGIVAYGSPGHNASNGLIPGGSGHAAAGLAYVDAQGQAAACVKPTAVTFESLVATRSARGVVVRWQTAFETDTVGYNVYRETAGKRVKLNRTLLSAGSSLAVHAYSWLDRSGRSGRYFVEALERNGASVWRGPALAR